MIHFKSLIISIFFSSFLFSQNAKISPGYKFYYKETSLESDDYKIYIEDAVAVDGWTKFKVRIFNKTNDYLIFNPADLVFKIADQTYFSKDKQISVPPNDESTKVVDVKGKGFQMENYKVELKKISKGLANAPAFKVEDYKIPIKQHDFKAGNFFCKTKGAVIKTDKTLIKFLCTYEGDDLGILLPSHVSATMPRGQENPNSNRNKGTLLEKGKADDFFIEIKELKGAGDMQKEPFVIKWNETFRETKLENLPGGEIHLELDKAKTYDKNK